MCRDEERALALVGGELAKQELGPCLVQRAERLVEQQQVGVVKEGAAEREPLEHPAREGAGALGSSLPETEALEQHADSLPPLGHAVQASVEVEVLERGQLTVDERLVREEAESRAVDVHLELAAGRGGEAGDKTEEGRLPGAVRPGDKNEGASFDFEVDTLQYPLIAEALREVARPDHARQSSSVTSTCPVAYERRMRRIVVVACLFACGLAVQVDSASACSCALGDPRRALALADAAFIGVLIDKREAGQAATFTFRVSETVKGKLGATVEVDSAADGAACGIEVKQGGSIGLLLDRSGERWTSSLCAQIAPADLRRAARPLPPPTGSGRTALLVGGSFGEARLLALDRKGRTLAYGYGDGEASLLSVCPGSRHAVEIVWDYPRVRVAVRALPTLRRVYELAVPQRVLAAPSESPSAHSCRNSTASELFLFSRTELGSRIVRVRNRRFSVVYRGDARHASFAGGVAYLTGQTDVTRLDLGTGKQARLAAVPEWTGPLVRSADGRRLIGVATPPPLNRLTPAPRVVLVDLGGPRARVRSVSLGRASTGGDVHWLSTARFLFLPGVGNENVARVYDLGLRVRSDFGGWVGTPSAVSAGVAFGLGFPASLHSARLPSGPVRSVRNFPSPVLRSLVAVPS